MPRYQDADVSFEVPPTWEDRTVVAFVAPPSPIDGEEGLAPNILLMRERLRRGDTLQAHADRSTEELNDTLAEFKVLLQRERVVGGRPAFERRFTWLSAGGPLEQTMLNLDPRAQAEAKRRATVSTLTLTTARPRVSGTESARTPGLSGS